MKNKCFVSVTIAFIITMTGCATIRFRGHDIVAYSARDSNGTEYLVLKEDHTFSVRDAFGYEWYGGKWHLDGDTLIMASEAYRDPYDELDTLTRMIVEQYCRKGRLPSHIPEDDPYRPFIGQAYEWYYKPLANAGDKQIFLVDRKCLKEAIPNNNFIGGRHGVRRTYYRIPQGKIKLIHSCSGNGNESG